MLTETSFPKSKRLISKNDFLYMKTESFRLREDSVLFVYKKSRLNDSEFNRLGLIVSKKNGNAVRRNQIKRSLRELYRKSQIVLTKNKYDFLMIINIPKDFDSELITSHLESNFLSLEKRISEKIC